MARLPYDPQHDIAPIVQLTRQPSILCVTNGLPVRSVADLIAFAKANPGKLNYASSGVGSLGHLGAELFKTMAGVDMKHIPYTGSAPAQNGLVGGHVDGFIDNAAAIIGLVRANSVRALAVTTPARSALVPEFPAISETVPGFAMTGWLGAAVNGRTSDRVQNEIQTACNDCLNEKATRERLESVIAEPVGGTTEAFVEFLGAERTRWGALIKTLSIQP
jgi:tripartite-type tricarboxylate transporter receptor subunit TctC